MSSLWRKESHFIDLVAKATLSILGTIWTLTLAEHINVIEDNIVSVFELYCSLFLCHHCAKSLLIINHSHIVKPQQTVIDVGKSTLESGLVSVEVSELSTFLSFFLLEIEAMACQESSHRVSYVTALPSTLISAVVTVSNETSVGNTSC